MARRHCVVSSQRKELEAKPLLSPKESEKHRSWSVPFGKFRYHVVGRCQEGGLRVGGQWCSLIMVGPLRGMYGETAELTAFLCLFRRITGATTAHVDKQRNH